MHESPAKTLEEMRSTQGDVLCAENGQKQRFQMTIKRVKKLLRDWTSNTAKKGDQSEEICN